MFNYKYLVISDLDGTLLNREGSLSPETIKYVHYLNTRDDILFTFNTGRPWSMCKEIYETLKLKGTVSCCNGAFLFNPHTQKTNYSFLSKNMVTSILQTPLMLNQLDHGYILTNQQDVDFNSKSSLSALKQIVDANLDVYGIKLFYSDTIKNLNEILSQIKSYFPLPQLTIFEQHGFFNIELQAGFVEKELAIKCLCNIYGVPLENSLIFGDSYNDISAMSFGSRSYAVKNAILIVKQKARFISQFTNDEDSVIKEVKIFLENLNI